MADDVDRNISSFIVSFNIWPNYTTGYRIYTVNRKPIRLPEFNILLVFNNILY